MAWLGGINPSSLNGPDPRKLRIGRDPKRDQPKVNAVSAADPPVPVDEFEPSVEARAVREEIEHAAAQHARKREVAEGGDGGVEGERGEEPPRPRLDLRG